MMNKNNIIALRIGDNSLSFAAEDNDSPVGLSYEPYIINSSISMAANLRKAFSSSSLLLKGFKRAAVFVSGYVLLVPVEEFLDGSKELLYETTFVKKERQVVVHTVIPDLSVVAIFAIDSDIKTVLDDHFSDIRIMPMTLPVWSFLNSRSYNNSRRKLYAYLHDDWTELFTFAQNRFKFCNSFRTSHYEDAAYYITNVWSQLGFDPQQDELHIAGKAQHKEELTDYVRQFLKNVYTVRPKADFNRHKFCEVASLPYDLLTYFINR